MRINFNNLTIRVIIGIVLGILVGFLFPEFGAQLKVLADIFIKLIKMLIAPIIFFTVVIGIGNMGDLKKVGRIGGKALIYFEIVTTFALAIGIIVVNLIQPGVGFNTEAVKGGDISQYTEQAKESGDSPILSSASFRIISSARWLQETCCPSSSLLCCSDWWPPPSARKQNRSSIFSSGLPTFSSGSSTWS